MYGPGPPPGQMTTGSDGWRQAPSKPHAAPLTQLQLQPPTHVTGSKQASRSSSHPAAAPSTRPGDRLQASLTQLQPPTPATGSKQASRISSLPAAVPATHPGGRFQASLTTQVTGSKQASRSSSHPAATLSSPNRPPPPPDKFDKIGSETVTPVSRERPSMASTARLLLGATAWRLCRSLTSPAQLLTHLPSCPLVSPDH